MSEKLLRGHGEPYLPVIIVDRLTVVPCTEDGMNHCTWGVGDILMVGTRALCYVCRYVVQPFMNLTMQTINPLSLVARLGDNKFIVQM